MAQHATDRNSAPLPPPGFYINPGGTLYNIDYGCTVGTNDVDTHSGDGATNYCKGRVWLHQYANNTGLTECFSYGTGGGVNRTYRNIQITRNDSPCP